MVKISVDLTKNVHQNAGIYFDKAKKAKKKIDGATIALERTKKKLAKLEKEGPGEIKEETLKAKLKKEWFEKFRWFYTSEGFLVIGGRDATTNEIVIKKHAQDGDIVFHTDMAGSPFYVIKKNTNILETPAEEIGDASLNEVANATGAFSRAWKKGLTSTQVFHVTPEQVTKEAQAGESLPKGAFMIRGKTTYITADLGQGIAIGNFNGKALAGAIDSIKSHCPKYIIITQGEKKPSEVSKLIRKELALDDLDEIIRVLPSGNMQVREIVNNSQ